MSDNDPTPAVETPVVGDAESNEQPEGNQPQEEIKTREGTEEGASTPTPSEKGEEKEKPAASVPKRLKFKIGDAEKEYDEEEIVKTLSERDTYKKGRDLYDRASLLLNELGKNTKSTLLDILTGVHGSKAKAQEAALKIADEIVSEQYKLAMMPEQERKNLSLQEELTEKSKRLEKFEREEADRQAALQNQKKINDYLGEVDKAIKEVKGLEDDPVAAQDIANAYVTCREEGHDVTAKEVAELVLKERKDKEKLWEDAQTSDPEKFLKKYPALIEKLREHDLNQIRENRNQAKTPRRAEPKTREDVSRKKVVTTAELHDILHKY